MARPLALIGVPTSAGAFAPGQEMAPAALRHAGLPDRLVAAGITVIVFFVVYQQLENHLLQPMIFSRTVKLNPLAVFVAILLGVTLLARLPRRRG